MTAILITSTIVSVSFLTAIIVFWISYNGDGVFLSILGFVLSLVIGFGAFGSCYTVETKEWLVVPDVAKSDSCLYISYGNYITTSKEAVFVNATKESIRLKVAVDYNSYGGPTQIRYWIIKLGSDETQQLEKQ